jgi:hypothetical protein
MIMTQRADFLGEINDVLDNELMSESELLWALLGAMETPEIRENWEYIKRCHELDDMLYGKPEDQGKYDRECFV